LGEKKSRIYAELKNVNIPVPLKENAAREVLGVKIMLFPDFNFF
jgi:hypothetical protein